MGPGILKTLLGTVVSALMGTLIATVRTEYQIAKVQTQVKLRELGKGLLMLVLAGIFGFFLVMLLLAAAVLGLSLIMDPWLAALVVAAAILIWVLILGIWGSYKLKKNKDLVPHRSVENIKNAIGGQ